MGFEFVVYGSAGCKWCDRICAKLRELGRSYEYIDLADSAGAREMFQRQGFKTVPQVFHTEAGKDPIHLGGHDATSRFLDEQKTAESL